ncbi:MAG: metal-dependent transcriptional regulator [Nitrospirota bacterium]|nr:metal-dependent transcriptional regulator [Nitrospirota bacterium]
MKITNITAEVVEAVWTISEKGECTLEGIMTALEGSVTDELLSEIEREGLLTINGSHVSLTGAGKKAARPIIRRHRLAERLLTDVLGMRVEDTEETACEYEHVIAPGLTESICTLLGHPEECPHGSPIPRGECCERAMSVIESAVKSISSFDAGDTLKVSYIRTKDHPLLHRLTSFGILPGIRMKIHQKFPTYVLQVNGSHIALETEIAQDIYAIRL